MSKLIDKYILGLDLGVGSVGWSCMLVNEEGDPYRILDLGSVIFSAEGGSVSDRRIARGIRRLIRRRKGRISRTKQLFLKYQYMDIQTVNNLFGQKGIILPDVYQTRIKGKTTKLTYEELLIILINYSKGRGFKSNRKVKNQESSDAKGASEDQKMLFAKQKTEEKLVALKAGNTNATITDLLLIESETIGSLHNSNGNYVYGLTRNMIDEEVNIILNKQVEFGLISEDFKKEYIDEILLFQRNFADGPDHGPYSDPLKKMIGTCQFTHTPRAAKATFSYELFTLVQKLNNIRYYFTDYKEKRSLTGEVISKLVAKVKDGKDIKYKDICEIVGEDVKFIGLQLDKKAYIEVIENLRKNPDSSMNVEMQKSKNATLIYSLKHYKEIRSVLKKILGKIPALTDKQYDLIAECFTRNKSDIEINEFITNPNSRTILKDINLPQEIMDNILNLNLDFSEFGKVSLDFIYDVLPLMINGCDYYSAAKEKGYDTANKIKFETEYDYIPQINDILEKLEKTITNRVVTKTIVESRKLVNAVIREYGKPMAIHVEMARDLTKNDDERYEMMNDQKNNQYINNSLKEQIYKKYGNRFTGIDKISGADLIQYKLFIEQGGICPYTLASTGDEMVAKISESDLFTSVLEVDHIVPFSITYDDRLINKALVYKKENSNKLNKIPGNFYKDCVGYNKYKNYIKSNSKIQLDKKNRYLAEKLDDSLLLDYRARTINDTRYAIKAFKEVLMFSFPSVKIRTITGQMTAKLRGVWRLNNLANSYRVADYRIKNIENNELSEQFEKLSKMYIDGVNKKDKTFIAVLRNIREIQKKDDLKNREDNLHHAVDATIIACSTDKLRRQVEMYEIYLKSATNKDNDVMFKIAKVDENGEIVGYDEILKTKEQYLEMINIGVEKSKVKYPQPYEHFNDELALRAYEMNENILQMRLMNLNLDAYKNVNMQQIKPIIVYHSYKRKSQGRLHKDTMYGIKDSEAGKILTQRISIKTEKFNTKSLDELYDKDVTQKYIYEAVLDWLSGYENGEKAYIGHDSNYPMNKNGNPINKVKVIYKPLKEAFEIRQGSKQYVEKENVVQVHVYTRENDEKMYFVGMDRFRALNIDKRDDFSLLLWYGRDKNNINLKYTELKQNGFIEKPKIFFKGQSIEIETLSGKGICKLVGFSSQKDGEEETPSGKGICKLVGFSSGMLEIASLVGDNYDLVNFGLAKIVTGSRNKITVSQIKSIKPISISLLGKRKK